MTVYSRRHILAENISVRDGKSSRSDPRMLRLLDAPTFVMQSDAFTLMQRTDCGAAIKAMHDADIFRLPYPKMVVEWQLRDGYPSHFTPHAKDDAAEPLHEFVHLEETVDPITGKFAISAEYSFMFVSSRIGGIFEDKLVFTHVDDGLNCAFHKAIDPTMREIAMGSGLIAINMALVLMNMKGIDREVHTFEALNKQRVRKGKQAIPQYTYVRIGHVYRADGTRVKYTEGDVRQMPMHVRSAHTRRQHFGKENSETKLIYVPSCIVNFDPHGGKTVPKQRIVKA
jgi:hypothetical protein